MNYEGARCCKASGLFALFASLILRHATFQPFPPDPAADIPAPMTRLARITALTLALLVAITSQQLAVARGMAMTAAGEAVLCTGQGTVTITLDDQGNPMGPVHICPDCALSLMAAVDAPPAGSTPVFHMQVLSQTAEPAFRIHPVHIHGNARAPPASV